MDIDILDRLEGINTREEATQWAADASREITKLRIALYDTLMHFSKSNDYRPDSSVVRRAWAALYSHGQSTIGGA